jgi:hypothetical protein
MPTSKHDSHLRYTLKLTRFGSLRWKRTADHNETFTTAIKGHFVVTVWEDKVGRYFRQEHRWAGSIIGNQRRQRSRRRALLRGQEQGL